MPQQVRMKHMGSTADDLEIEYSIFEDEKRVTMKTNTFDSQLIEDFLKIVLKQKHGIDAVRDDRTEWNPPRPPYRVYLLLNEVRYEVEAHHLVEIGRGGSFTVVLRPC